MVDFNSEGAFTANKSHILELVILGRRDELINTFQLWRESLIANDSREEKFKHKLRAVLFSLFLELERPLFRKLSERKVDSDVLNVVKYNDLRRLVFSVDHINNDDLVDAYLTFNRALDEMNLIKIDNKKKFDSTNIELENDIKGI